MFRKHDRRQRRGVALVLIALLTLPLIAMAALAVDYGYLLTAQNDLQRAADMTALAAVRELVPTAQGSQVPSTVFASAREYARENFGPSFTVLDGDVEMGRFEPSTIYSQVQLQKTGTWDTVRVTLRRDASANSPVALFFAPVLGARDVELSATATAVLQKPQFLPPGADILPFTMSKAEWDPLTEGDVWTIYGDGKVENEKGNTVSGNWGTVDIGSTNNSTSDLRDQIVNGLRETDLEALHKDGRIDQDAHIDPAATIWLQGDPGLSSGMKSAVEEIHGQRRIIPLYDELGDSKSTDGDSDAGDGGKGKGKGGNGAPGGGNNLEYKVVAWGVVYVIDSGWGGTKNTFVRIQKSYLYDSDLTPNPDLSSTSVGLPAAFTSPVLVE